MDTITVSAVITALIQAVKHFVPGKFLPLVAVFFGVAYSTGTGGIFDFQTILSGVVYGLSSVGLYEGIKTPVVEIKKRI